MNTTFLGGRYELLDLIGQGGMGAVYRARDRLVGNVVALKRVAIPSEQLQYTSKGKLTNYRLNLAQEFKVLASLRHPHIISVLDYGFDQDQQPFYTMELLENARSIVAYGNDLAFERQVDLLIQVLQALDYLHHRGILHRDLKPDNIMIVNDEVKVLDFGLAVGREHLEQAQGEIVGTLAYMAPEILQEQPATSATDLYGFGLIAYEVFWGEAPFQTKDIGNLLMNILQTQPNLDQLDLPLDLTLMLERCLAKDPTERYQSAHLLLQELTRLIGHEREYESIDIRNSFLQAAHFVGREKELELLSSALKEIFSPIGAIGTAWLIGGESGAGKSRLVDEIRTQALVAGAVVMRGQAIAEGGAAYQLWREVMRWLVLLTRDISPEELSIAKELVPDIESIVGQAVPDAPPAFNPRAAQERLLDVFEKLLRRQKQAMVILLEDLHWAVESIDVLKHLISFCHELPLFIISTYRNDERPHLPEELPKMRPITLQRLDKQQVYALSQAILGEEANHSDVSEYLHQESEGNIFFIIELMRTLAEEAGELADIGRMSLPQNLVVGGIRQIVQRRLERIPASARPLLELAAIAGRYLDLNLLKNFAQSVKLEDWLVICADAAVLEVHEGKWRFAHDKLRDGITSNLAEIQTQDLHRQVAQAIEAIYPNDPSYIIPLYVHWSRANNPEKECLYAQQAGTLTFKTSQFRESLHYFERALVLSTQEEMKLKILVQLVEAASLVDGKRARLYSEQATKLASELKDYQRLSSVLSIQARVVMMRDADLTLAAQLQEQAINAARQSGDPITIAGALRQLGNFHLFVDEFEKAFPYLDESAVVAKEHGNLTLLGFSLNSLSNGYGRRAEGNDLERAYALAQEVVEIANQLGNRRLLMMGIAHLGLVPMMRQDYAEGYRYFLEAYQITRDIHDTEQMGKVNNYVALCLLGMGDYESAFTSFVEALQQSKTYNVIPELIRSLAGLGVLWRLQGFHTEAYQLLTYALTHPICNPETKKMAMPHYEALSAQLDEATRQNIVSEAANYQLDTLTNAIFASAKAQKPIF